MGFNDGRLDIVVAHVGTRQVAVLQQAVGGVESLFVAPDEDSSCAPLAIGNLNADGRAASACACGAGLP